MDDGDRLVAVGPHSRKTWRELYESTDPSAKSYVAFALKRPAVQPGSQFDQVRGYLLARTEADRQQQPRTPSAPPTSTARPAAEQDEQRVEAVDAVEQDVACEFFFCLSNPEGVVMM